MLAQAHTDIWIVHLPELPHLLFLAHWLYSKTEKLSKPVQTRSFVCFSLSVVYFYPLCIISNKEISKPSITGWKSAWCLYISEDYSAHKGGRKCGCMHVQIFSINPFLIGLLLNLVLPAPLRVLKHFRFSSGNLLLEVAISLLFGI